MALYRGFSFSQYEKTKTFQVLDSNVIKMDLLSHIFTLLGSRIMMPTFGTTIPEDVFEQINPDLVIDIREQLEEVFDFDPRVRTIELSVIPDPDTNSIICNVKLFFIELNVTEGLDFNIDLGQ